MSFTLIGTKFFLHYWHSKSSKSVSPSKLLTEHPDLTQSKPLTHYPSNKAKLGKHFTQSSSSFSRQFSDIGI